MSEEEAIEYLKNYTIWNQTQGFSKGNNDKAIDTVLKALEKKDYLIHTMEVEFNRLEDLEDNTVMLKMELEKKDKIIKELKEHIDELSQTNYSF